jgi:GMP synthase-like glutamine amidotransferase
MDALVMLDGPQRVVRLAEDEVLQESLRLLKAARKADVPILGVGLGAELLAFALGAQVWEGRTRGREKELGWVRVDLTERGRVDPGLRGFHELEPVFAWHEDSFDLPEGAWRLASNRHYPTQAFRHGRWRYGIEFHLEVTAQMVAEWVDRYMSRPGCEYRGADLDEIVQKAARYCVRLEEKAQVLGRHFLWLMGQSRLEKG